MGLFFDESCLNNDKSRKEVHTMSYHEIAKNMIDHLSESQMIFVINMLEGLGELSGINVHPEFISNAETLEVFAETEEMIRSGSGQHFKGSAEDFFAMLDVEE